MTTLLTRSLHCAAVGIADDAAVADPAAADTVLDAVHTA